METWRTLKKDFADPRIYGIMEAEKRTESIQTDSGRRVFYE